MPLIIHGITQMILFSHINQWLFQVVKTFLQTTRKSFLKKYTIIQFSLGE